MVLGYSEAYSMRFKLFKSVSNVLISSLVVLFQLRENLRYPRIPHKALLLSDRVRSNQSYIEDVDPPPSGGVGSTFSKIFL